MTTRRRIKNEVAAVQRLKKDYLRIQSEKLPYITAVPDPRNILEWHYVLNGPKDTPFYGGYYHGLIKFPADFPFQAPSLSIVTPNGRFKTNTKLCLSNSNFHQESWCPTWSVSTILTGLLSFMLETAPTYGSIESSDAEKRRLAKESLKFNLKSSQFCEFFPEIADEIREKLDKEIKTPATSEQTQSNTDTTSPGSLVNRKQIIQSIVLNLTLVIAFIIVIFLCKYVVSLSS